EWTAPRTPLDGPLLVWLGVCILSWIWSYTHHAAFFQGAMRAQGLNAFGFLAACTLAPFYLGAVHARQSRLEKEPVLRPAWWIFFVAWGLLWTLHSSIAAPAPPLTLEGHFWDPYGGALWLGGFGILFWLTKDGTIHDLWRVALGVAFLSGVYGIAQYLGMEMIWPRTVNPYGGRSVWTFGNPNFVSSY